VIPVPAAAGASGSPLNPGEPGGWSGATAAARQRRHRRSGAVTKPAANPVAFRAADGLPQLLTDAQLEHWAGELDIDLDQLDQLVSLIGRQMLSLFENDPKEAARWLLRELGWLGLNDVSEAISEVMVEEADDEPITE
jgi:hypothetical protein